MSLLLVTGATGEVARGVLPILDDHFELRLLAADPNVDDPRYRQVDLLDWSSLARAMQNVDAVLHLAIASGHTGTYEEDVFNDRRFDVNVKGTYHVCETACRAGVRRIVHVSSAMVTWGHAQRQASPGESAKVSGDAPPSPVGTYALTKALSEQIARYYAEQQKTEIIVVRITAPLDIAAADLRKNPFRPQQIPFPDLAQAFLLALTAPVARFEVVTVAGDSSRSPWSMEAARRVLGYAPQICLDELGLKLLDPFAVDGR